MKHRPTWLEPVPMQVLAAEPETADTASFQLACGPAGPIAAGDPGQFNMLYAFGIGEAAISISSTAPDRSRLTHTVRAVGPVSSALCRLRAGDWVGVRGPFGTGWPIARARGKAVILIAGGIGLAPLRPAIEAVLRERAAFDRLLVFYGARTPHDRIFVAELAAWQESADIDVTVTVDTGGANWSGLVGFVTAPLARARFDPGQAIAMACGPEVMMRAVAQQLQERGMAGGDIYLSMERNMKCAVGLCGHCQFGADFVCKDGPVFPYPRLASRLTVREI